MSEVRLHCLPSGQFLVQDGEPKVRVWEKVLPDHGVAAVIERLPNYDAVAVQGGSTELVQPEEAGYISGKKFVG